MSFRVTARTVLQLGAELISSDEVAFYELIKNSIDTGSPKVQVDVIVRLPDEALKEVRGAGLGTNPKTLDRIRQAIDRTAPHHVTSVRPIQTSLEDVFIARLAEATP